MDVGKLDIAGLEPVSALIQLYRVNFAQDLAQLRDRIIGQMGIGDMALRAVNGDPHIDRSAPPDLHHIAQPVNRSGFTDKAKVRRNATLFHQLHDRNRAKAGGAFLVAGDDEADRAEIVRHVLERADKSGDAALHIHRAASVKQIAPDFRHEGVAGPAFTRRHNVEMPGKGKMACSRPAFPDGKKIFDSPAGILILRHVARNEARHFKTQRFEHRRHHIKNSASSGRDTGTGDQLFGQIKGGFFGHYFTRRAAFV